MARTLSGEIGGVILRLDGRRRRWGQQGRLRQRHRAICATTAEGRAGWGTEDWPLLGQGWAVRWQQGMDGQQADVRGVKCEALGGSEFQDNHRRSVRVIDNKLGQ